MTYTKQTWVDEVLSADARYTIKEDGGGAFKDDMQIDLKTTKSVTGSDFSASRRNHMEQGIEDAEMGDQIHASTSATPAIVDEFGFWQSASNVLRKMTWSTLKSYFVKTAGDETITGVKHFSDRVVQFSDLYPIYRKKFVLSADVNWKTVISISLASATYSGANFEVLLDVGHQSWGGGIDVSKIRYIVRARRSGGVIDDRNDGSVSGGSTAFCRLVKTSTGNYELQVSQDAAYQEMTVRVRALETGNATLTYHDTPATGSSSGTIYTAAATHIEFVSNFYALGDISALTFTDRTPAFSGDALTEIAKIKNKDGEIDHTSLPEFARVKRKKMDCEGKIISETTERSLGAMITMQTRAIQQLAERVSEMEQK